MSTTMVGPETPARGWNPGPWGSGGFVMVNGRRYRVWHPQYPGHGLNARRLDHAWGVIICDRVAPRGSLYLLDNVPTLAVATY